jgi:glycine/D-amino acid oxidase-like deaminating enzyme
LPQRSDLVVVGAGVAGAATACFLAKAGRRVRLVEAEHPGFGASGRNPGFLFLLGKARGLPLDVSLAGRAFQERLSRELGDFGFRATGMLAFVRDPRALPLLEAFAAQRRADGLEVQLLDRRATLAREPALDPAVAGALWSAGEAHQDTRLLVRRLAAAAEAAGAEVMNGHRVEALVMAGSRCAGLRLADGTLLSAGTVVLANALDAGRLLAPLGLAPPLTATRYQAAETAPAGFRLGSLLSGPSLFLHLPLLAALPGFDKALFTDPVIRLPPGMSFTHQIAQYPDGRLQFGCACESGQALAEATAAGQAPALATLPRDLPGTAALTIERQWAGVVAQAPDYLPILDLAPGPEGLALNVGHAFGNLIGAMSGQIVAAQLTGGKPAFDPAPFTLRRFSNSTTEKPSPRARGEGWVRGP